MVFYAAKTKYHCKVENGDIVKDLVPTVIRNNKRQWDGCHLYAGNNTTETIPCTDGWTYDLEDGEATIISEFNLVCDDAYKSDLATTIYFTGVTVSGPLFGVLADKYGRKPVIGFTMFASGVVSLAIAIFRSYVAFVTLRFILGFLIQGLHNTTFSLAMEVISTKYRPHVGVILPGSSHFGALIFDLLAYLVRDWKYIQLALALFTFVQLGSLWFLPESIRLHMLYNKFDKAEATIAKVVKVNKIPFPRNTFEQIKYQGLNDVEELRSAKKSNVFDVFKYPSLRKISFMLFFIWFSIAVSYFGLALNISYLPGNKYLNYAISCSLDLFAAVSLCWAVPRYGRRKPLAVAFFICAMATCVCSVITSRASGTDNLKFFATATALLGKACSAGTLSIIYTFTSELYPTVVRYELP